MKNTLMMNLGLAASIALLATDANAAGVKNIQGPFSADSSGAIYDVHCTDGYIFTVNAHKYGDHIEYTTARDSSFWAISNNGATLSSVAQQLCNRR